MATKKDEIEQTAEPMRFLEKLSAIQTKIKAPKNLYNKFGEYYYRNAEGILEAVKPYLAEYNLILILNDEIVLIGERYYVKATVTLRDAKTDASYEVSAYARETLDRPKMDVSQITGSASSYARKYALNGLFLLDDTKDADTDEFHKQTEQKTNEQKSSEQNKEDLKKLWIQASGSDEGFEEYFIKAKGNTNQGFATIKAQLLKKINDKKEANNE